MIDGQSKAPRKKEKKRKGKEGAVPTRVYSSVPTQRHRFGNGRLPREEGGKGKKKRKGGGGDAGRATAPLYFHVGHATGATGEEKKEEREKKRRRAQNGAGLRGAGSRTPFLPGGKVQRGRGEEEEKRETLRRAWRSSSLLMEGGGTKGKKKKRGNTVDISLWDMAGSCFFLQGPERGVGERGKEGGEWEE